MSDTRAAAWQWMQMLPLTLWSPPPAEALHQHSALPGSSCRCCPYWRVQKLFFLADCASLRWWCCSGECSGVTPSETHYLCLFFSATVHFLHLLHCHIISFFCCFVIFFYVEWLLVFCCHGQSVFWLFLVPVKVLWFWFCPMPVIVMEINFTTEVFLIEILNPTMCITQTKGVGKGPPNKIQPTMLQP